MGNCTSDVRSCEEARFLPSPDAVYEIWVVPGECSYSVDFFGSPLFVVYSREFIVNFSFGAAGKLLLLVEVPNHCRLTLRGYNEQSRVYIR